MYSTANNRRDRRPNFLSVLSTNTNPCSTRRSEALSVLRAVYPRKRGSITSAGKMLKASLGPTTYPLLEALSPGTRRPVRQAGALFALWRAVNFFSKTKMRSPKRIAKLSPKHRCNTVFGIRILFRVKEYADSLRTAYRRGLVNKETGLMFIGPCIILIVEYRETNLMSLALLFLYLMLSMFRTLIHPSSGAYDLCAELFHGLH